jgi:AcrR family transcriptional regulator
MNMFIFKGRSVKAILKLSLGLAYWLVGRSPALSIIERIRHTAVMTKSTRSRAKRSKSMQRNGKRELNKIDKLLRIKIAARSVFLSKGYDDATMREIAYRAGVGLGTLFIYATDKRDLLFLVINGDFDDLASQAAATLRPDVSLMTNLLSVFRPLYKFFAANPKLSRFALREWFFYQAGTQAALFQATRSRMTTITSDAVRIAQERQEVSGRLDAALVGRIIFSVYQIEVRDWLSRSRLNVTAGLGALENALALITIGLSLTTTTSLSRLSNGESKA